MSQITVRRVALVVGLLCCASCKVTPEATKKGLAAVAASTFTFTTTFGPDGCPLSSTPDVANCANKKLDCLQIHGDDHVKFRPVDSSKDPKHKIRFDVSSKLTTKADAKFAVDDGKHWDLEISPETPRETEHKFSVISDVCPGKPLDPSIIIMP